jgi:SAM-dependent methyltransferase
MIAFFVGLSLICASTLMYEIVLTRLLSAICWYYLAFVSISIAMFGMTAGALAVQLRPSWFNREEIPKRILQAVFATAVSMPLALVTMLAIPLDISFALQTLFSFLLFCSVIAVPFFFSGVAVCLALTKTAFPIGRIYFADLFGASVGSVAAVLLLKLVDAPSGMFVISGVLFLSSAAFATYARDKQYRLRSYVFAIGMLIIAGLNASTLHGIQPIWVQGRIDRRDDLAAEVWNPISKVRAFKPLLRQPDMWGPSPRMPRVRVEEMPLDIDSGAATPMVHFQGDLTPFSYLRYDVTSLGAQLRTGGTAAIIGVGGGRDVMNSVLNGFRRIVGIEINSAIVDLDTRRFASFSGFNKIPGLELHNDEGRSYLTRTNEKFDLIQASLVDTWAATSAGSLTLVENSLYTVDAWQIFYRHLKPGGLITFSRWYSGLEAAQTHRLFAVAWAMLLSQGIDDPGNNIALVSSDKVSTILVSNQPLSQNDLEKIRANADQMEFKTTFFPGQETSVPELRTISSMRSLGELARLRDASEFDYSPVFDSSPYFFNALRVRNIPRLIMKGGHGSNLHALLFVFIFMLSASLLVVLAIILPVTRWARSQSGTRAPAGGIVYFVSIGLGFMLIEIAMMQQLSIFLGHPIYSLVVVLGGLILSTGIGSLVSDRLRLGSRLASLVPAIAVTLIIVLYSAAVIPVIHRFTAEVLWHRAALSLILTMPCGFLMGFCFPVGLRWMSFIKQEHNLPWMWALNGAAATLGSFVAIVISMETSITICTLAAATCYLVAAIAIALIPQQVPIAAS